MPKIKPPAYQYGRETTKNALIRIKGQQVTLLHLLHQKNVTGYASRTKELTTVHLLKNLRVDLPTFASQIQNATDLKSSNTSSTSDSHGKKYENVHFYSGISRNKAKSCVPQLIQSESQLRKKARHLDTS